MLNSTEFNLEISKSVFCISLSISSSLFFSLFWSKFNVLDSKYELFTSVTLFLVFFSNNKFSYVVLSFLKLVLSTIACWIVLPSLNLNSLFFSYKIAFNFDNSLEAFSISSKFKLNISLLSSTKLTFPSSSSIDIFKA